MPYISAIVVDFGSSNSGCARIISFDQNEELEYSTPQFIHSNGAYAKDETWIYIEPSFFERIKTNYNSLADTDFRIESRIQSNTQNPNIVWGRESIINHANTLNNIWIGFSHFKMALYNNIETYEEHGNSISTKLLISVFLRVLKLDCIFSETKRIGRIVNSSEIQWGVTIPSIWSDYNKQTMEDIVHNVFPPNTRILSEPEGPIVANMLHTGVGGKVEFQDDRISLVVDMGGGTTDICLMQEKRQTDGSYKFEMIQDTDGRAAGGNDIDNNYWTYMLRYISNGKRSDSDVDYNSLSDKALKGMILDPYMKNVSDRIEIEDSWYKQKHRQGIYNLGFVSSYLIWLRDNGHTELCEVVKHFLIGQKIDSNDLYNKVFKPTYDKIIEKVIEVIDAAKQKYTIDNYIFAGGLSLNEKIIDLLRIAINQAINRLESQQINYGALSNNSTLASGSIMDGSCYILLNRQVITRFAKKNYYYDSWNSIQNLRCDYQDRFDINLGLGYISDRVGRNKVLLSPIALENQLIKNNYNQSLSVDNDQQEFNITFYSNNNEIAFLPEDETCQQEGKIDVVVDNNSSRTYMLEVDFNEAQISNAIYYILKDGKTNKLIKDGYIKNAIN